MSLVWNCAEQCLPVRSKVFMVVKLDRNIMRSKIQQQINGSSRKLRQLRRYIQELEDKLSNQSFQQQILDQQFQIQSLKKNILELQAENSDLAKIIDNQFRALKKDPAMFENKQERQKATLIKHTNRSLELSIAGLQRQIYLFQSMSLLPKKKVKRPDSQKQRMHDMSSSQISQMEDKNKDKRLEVLKIKQQKLAEQLRKRQSMIKRRQLLYQENQRQLLQQVDRLRQVFADNRKETARINKIVAHLTDS